MTTVPILLGFNGSNYQVTRSLRFRASATAYLSRTPASASNQKTWTWSGWVKRGVIGTTQILFTASNGSSSIYELRFISDGGVSGVAESLQFTCPSGYAFKSTAVQRDPSAWGHVVLSVDTTQATASNRAKIYYNGVILPSDGTANLSLNENTSINAALLHTMGVRAFNTTLPFDGYLAEVNFIDGQALTPSSFGYFDLYGVWQPKKYNGTFGTNGFYLPFSNTTSTTTLTADSSGNGNNWTANNISLTAGTTYDSMIDSPTNYADGGTGRGNYAVLNPLDHTNNSYATLSNANLQVLGNSATDSGAFAGTISITSGKWYFEFTRVGTGNFAMVGLCIPGISSKANEEQTANSFSGYRSDGGLYGINTSGTPSSWNTDGDIIGVAVDADNGAIYFAKNNTWQNSGVPTSGASKTGAVTTFTAGSYTIAPFGGGYQSGNGVIANFGQRPFTYTPPSGYLALNTQNLPAAPVPYGAPYMNAITYTGYGPLVPSGLGILTKRNASTQNVSKSLRFRASASAYLNRTNASNGNLNTWTISFWIKRGASITGSNQCVIGTSYTSLSEIVIRFNSDDTFRFEQYASGGTTNLGTLVTSQVFRDPSAWYHFTIIFDSSNATASSRVRLYVNGTQVTAFSSATYPAQNANSIWNNNANTQFIGKYSTAQHFDGYLAEVNFIDGQALTPSSFGQTNSDGIWVPKAYTGTYGTNGFYLPFTNTTSTTTLVADSSGNGNNWTPNNISLTAGTTYDSMIDSPTDYASAGDYAVFNPLDKGAGITLSNANLTAYSNAQGPYIARSTIAVSSGKWYWEAVQTAQGSAATNNMVNGICPPSDSTTNIVGYTAGSYGYIDTGNKANNSVVTAYGATYGLNDIIGVALDLDNGTLTFYKNGVSQGVAFTGISGTFLFAVSDRGGGVSKEPTWAINFGQRPFTYSAPSGYSTLNTYNITAPSTTWFSSANNSGNASATAYPDFVWIKSRSSAQNHSLNDTLRGPTLNLLSNSTAAEAGASTMFAVNKYGLTLGNDASVNSSSYTDVMWGWQGGNGTTSTNTSGTITSQVSASTTSGVSIVTYTETSGSYTVGHGLGATPAMIILRERNAVSNWIVWNQYWTAPTRNGVYLNATNAAFTTGSNWLNSTSSTTFGITAGQVTAGTANIVVYCFAAIRGFSAYGSYSGNGSTDGAFVYTGFRPRFVMVKRIDAAESWITVDTTRDPYNSASAWLYPNLSNAEATGSALCDILSNGFKLKSTVSGGNISGGTYVYFAFAENPFNMSRAR